MKLNRIVSANRGRFIALSICSLLSISFVAIAAFLLLQSKSKQLSPEEIAAQQAAQQEIAVRLQRLRDAGKPTTPVEANAHFLVSVIPDETTSRWLGALQPFQLRDYLTDAQHLPIVDLGGIHVQTPAEWLEFELTVAFLKKYEPALARLRELADQSSGVQFAPDFKMPMLHQKGERDRLGLVPASRTLALDAYVRARQGDTSGALRSISTILRIADTLKQDPLVYSQAARAALLGTACHVLSLLMYEHTFDRQQLQDVQKLLMAANAEWPLTRAIDGQRVLGIEVILAESIEEPRESRYADVLPYLDCMDTLQAAESESWPKRLAAVQSARVQLFAAVPWIKEWYGRRNPSQVYSIGLALDRELEVCARGAALLSLAEIAIAIDGYYRDSQQSLGELTKLVPRYLRDVPLDPFSGAPIRFANGPDGYLVYSVGPNGIDDQCAPTSDDIRLGDPGRDPVWVP